MSTVIQEAESILAQVAEAHLAFECRQTLASHLAAVQLPPPILSRLQHQWAYAPGRWPSQDAYAAALEVAIAQEAESLDSLREHLLTSLDREDPTDHTDVRRITAQRRRLVAGYANNGAVEPIVVSQFADPTDWYLVCDPTRIESIEVGFVNGRQTPELLVQAHPAFGQVFTNDQLTYKIRWEFGAGWIDHRAAYWS